MYIVKRTHRLTSRAEFWCQDTARSFWLKAPDKRWLKACFTAKAAGEALEAAKGGGVSWWWSYAVAQVNYSSAELARYKFSPIDGDKNDIQNSV